MANLSRRHLLSTAAGILAFGTLPPLLRSAATAADAPVILKAQFRTIEVDGKPARVFGIVQPDGTHGLYTRAGERFRVRLMNQIDSDTLVHWHGLTPPYDQDGVPDLSQPPLRPGQVYDYDFPLKQAGTFWMHSHVGLQEQQLLAAPLIIRDPAEAGLDEQEVVVFLHDFTFRDPGEILEELAAGMGHAMPSQGAAPSGSPHHSPGRMDHSAMGHGAPQAPAATPSAGATDVNDVEFDAYLANDRTLADPEVVRVEPGGRLRLRIINGAAATNFVIDLGALEGTLVAVDGRPVVPIAGSRFELAISQRLDIRLHLPRSQGAYAVLAQREGASQRTGIVLATKGAAIRHIAELAAHPMAPLGFGQELRLRAPTPLPRRTPDRTHVVALTGSMAGYVWTIDGARYGEHKPLPVARGERVEIVLRNRTEMAHPMHLHGHVFQVVGFDGARLSGAFRDTVLVPVNSTVTIAFDADNPGPWAFHCHNLYHMAAGMMTTVEYLA